MNIQSPTVALRVALYLRVSTARQAEHDISIPDQRKQGEAWCAARGYRLIETFIESGPKSDWQEPASQSAFYAPILPSAWPAEQGYADADYEAFEGGLLSSRK